MVRMSPETMCCLDTAIEFSKFHRTEIYEYLYQNNIDVDTLFDNKEMNFFEKITNDFKKWYKTTPQIKKDIIFYRMLLECEYDFNIKSKELAKILMTIDPLIISTKSNQLSFKKLNSYIKNQIQLENSDKLNSWLKYDDSKPNLNSALKILIDFKHMFKKINSMKKNIKHTLQECLNYEYAIRHEEMSSSINHLRNFDNELINGLGLSNNNEFSNLISKNVEKKDFKLKKEEKSFKKIVSKSITTLQSFIGTKNVSSFVHGDNFTIDGKLFNYKLAKKESYSLLDKRVTSTMAIPYHLSLLDKNNNHLCDMCVVFNDCPIFDQILSVYMMIKANEEIKLLNNSNIFNIKDKFYENKHILKTIHSIKTKKEYNLNVDLNNNIELSFETVRKENLMLETIKENYLKKQLEPQLFDFIFRTEPTWDEMIDYVGIQMNFVDDRLDYLVKN